MGKKKNLKAKVKPGKNILKTAKKVRYLVSDPKIIKISKSGKIKALKKGVAIIYSIAVNGVWKATRVTVK